MQCPVRRNHFKENIKSTEETLGENKIVNTHFALFFYDSTWFPSLTVVYQGSWGRSAKQKLNAGIVYSYPELRETKVLQPS